MGTTASDRPDIVDEIEASLVRRPVGVGGVVLLPLLLVPLLAVSPLAVLAAAGGCGVLGWGAEPWLCWDPLPVVGGVVSQNR